MKKNNIISLMLMVIAMVICLGGCSSQVYEMEPIALHQFHQSLFGDYELPDVETIVIKIDEYDAGEEGINFGTVIEYARMSNYPMGFSEAEEDVREMNPEFEGMSIYDNLKAGTIIKIKNYDYGKTENTAAEEKVTTEEKATTDVNATQVIIPEEYRGTWVATKNGTSKYTFSQNSYSYSSGNSTVSSGSIERIENSKNSILIFYPANVAHGFTVNPGVKGDGLIEIDGYEYKKVE